MNKRSMFFPLIFTFLMIVITSCNVEVLTENTESQANLSVVFSSEKAVVSPEVTDDTVIRFDAESADITITSLSDNKVVFSAVWTKGHGADFKPVTITKSGEYLIHVVHSGKKNNAAETYEESLTVTINPDSNTRIHLTPGGVGIIKIDSRSRKDCSSDLIGNFGTIQVPQNGDNSLRGISATDHYLILGRVRDTITRKGYVEIYNRATFELLRTIQGSTEFFGHGIASDNVSFWTSDYFDSDTIYQYSIATGELLNQWNVEGFHPVRMELNPENGNLFICGYNSSKVYEYSQEGQLIRSIEFIDGGVNPSVKRGDDCWYVYCSPANPESDLIFYTYSNNWKLIGQQKAGWGNWDFDIIDDKIYCDSPEEVIEIRSFNL